MSSEEPKWIEHAGIKVPVAGSEEARQDLLAGRKLGPQGQSPEEWSQEWRAGHSAHYKQLILVLQSLDVEDRLMDIRSKALLVGARLDREDLSGLDMRGLNLTNASFRGADLSGASLQNTQLVKADLSRASLHLANLSGAVVDGSDLSFCYAKGTLWQGASAQRVWFRRTYLDGALFFDCSLRLSDFLYASCWGARFDGADLEDVHNLDTAVFVRWLKPDGAQTWSDKPRDGWVPCWSNPMSNSSFQVNAGRTP